MLNCIGAAVAAIVVVDIAVTEIILGGDCCGCILRNILRRSLADYEAAIRELLRGFDTAAAAIIVSCLILRHDKRVEE